MAKRTLCGYTAIANHYDVSKGTVRRWCAELGAPIVRGGETDLDELDAWMNGESFVDDDGDLCLTTAGAHADPDLRIPKAAFVDAVQSGELPGGFRKLPRASQPTAFAKKKDIEVWHENRPRGKGGYRELRLKDGAPATAKTLREAAKWFGCTSVCMVEWKKRLPETFGEKPYDLKKVEQEIAQYQAEKRGHAPSEIERDGKTYYTVYSHEDWSLSRIEMQRIPGPRKLTWKQGHPKVCGWTADQIQDHKRSKANAAGNSIKPTPSKVNPDLERPKGTVSMKSARRLSKLSHETITKLIEDRLVPGEKKKTVIRANCTGPKGKKYVAEHVQESYQIDREALLKVAKPEERPTPNTDPNLLPIGEIAKKIGKHENTVRALYDAKLIEGMENQVALLTVTKTKPKTGETYEVKVRRPGTLLLNLKQAMRYAPSNTDPHHEFDDTGKGTVWLPDALIEEISGITIMILEEAFAKGRITQRKFIRRRVMGGCRDRIRVTEQNEWRVYAASLGRELPEPIPFDAEKVIPADSSGDDARPDGKSSIKGETVPEAVPQEVSQVDEPKPGCLELIVDEAARTLRREGFNNAVIELKGKEVLWELFVIHYTNGESLVPFSVYSTAWAKAGRAEVAGETDSKVKTAYSRLNGMLSRLGLRVKAIEQMGRKLVSL